MFIMGGQRAGKWNFTDPDPVLEAEIFDPAIWGLMRWPIVAHAERACRPTADANCRGHYS
jgi:hypothetical protein